MKHITDIFANRTTNYMRNSLKLFFFPGDLRAQNLSKMARVILREFFSQIFRVRGDLQLVCCQVIEADRSLDGAVTVIGTPHYFSPEMCRGAVLSACTAVFAQKFRSWKN